MSVRINLESALLSTYFILNNVKSINQVKKDLLQDQCYITFFKLPKNFNEISLSELFDSSLKDIDLVRYYDGRIFYKRGNEFHTPDLIQVFNDEYTQ